MFLAGRVSLALQLSGAPAPALSPTPLSGKKRAEGVAASSAARQAGGAGGFPREMSSRLLGAQSRPPQPLHYNWPRALQPQICAPLGQLGARAKRRSEMFNAAQLAAKRLAIVRFGTIAWRTPKSD